jgi:hypothetical protein
MLQELLALVYEGGARSSSHLSRQLDVSKGLLDGMLRDLARMGYLRPAKADCRACHRGCLCSGACTTGQTGRIWALTEKGRRASRTGGVDWNNDRDS